MTVEQIELRKILSQMLADQGINQNTLRDMVNEILDEKISKIVKDKLEQSDGPLDWMREINRKADDYVKAAAREEVRSTIANAMRGMYVEVNLKKD